MHFGFKILHTLKVKPLSNQNGVAATDVKKMNLTRLFFAASDISVENLLWWEYVEVWQIPPKWISEKYNLKFQMQTSIWIKDSIEYYQNQIKIKSPNNSTVR